jgi:hypothetical protein
MQNEVKIVLTGDSRSAAEALDQIGRKGEAAAATTSSAWGKLSGVFTTLQANWIALAGAFASTYVIRNLIELGAKVQQVEASFKELTSTAAGSGRELIGSMSRAVAGTVDESDLMQKAIKGMTQGLTAGNMVQISEMARVTARTQGISVAEAVDRITDSVANQMPRALKQFGLMTTEQMGIVNRAIAAGVENVDLLGLAYENLQVKLAKLGPVVDDASERLQRNKADVQDLTENLAKLAVTITGEVADAFGKLANYAKTVVAANMMGTTPEDLEKIRMARMPDVQDWAYGPDTMAASKEGAIKAAEASAKAKMEAIKAATDAAKAKDNIEALAKQFDAWKVSINNLNPALDDVQKKLNEINQQSKKFSEGGIDKKQVDLWKATAVNYTDMAEYLKNRAERRKEEETWAEETRQNNQALAMDREEYEKEITGYLADELGKRLFAEEESARKLKELASKSAADYEAEAAKIDAKRDQNQARIRAELSQRAGQAAIEASIAGVERAAKSYEITRPAATQQLITLYGDLLTKQEAYLSTLSETSDNTAWLTQAKQIEETRNKLTDLAVQAKEFTGTLQEGITRGAVNFGYEIGGAFKQGEDLAKKSAGTMQQAFSDFFFDPMNFSLADLANSFRRIFADYLSNQVMRQLLGATGPGGAPSGGGLVGSLASLVTRFFSGGTQSVEGISGGVPANANYVPGIYHSGGVVGATQVPLRWVPPSTFANAPRLHSGLASDEYAAILQRGETVIPKGGAPSVTPNVTVLVQNNSGSKVTPDAQPRWDDSMKKWVVGVMIEDDINGGPYWQARGMNPRRR